MVKGIFQTFADGDPELLQALREFNEFRNKKKKPLTDEAKKRFCKKLEKYPREQWIALIHQSIDKGWAGIYDLKEDAATEDTGNDKTSLSWALNRRPYPQSFIDTVHKFLAEEEAAGRYKPERPPQ